MKITANFRPYENGAMKGYVDLVVGGSIGIKDARLVEGSNGLFVAMPQIKVGDEYRDVITGVSKDFIAQALEATLAARDSEDGHASIGEGNVYFNARANALEDQTQDIKALASLTVRESKETELSAFTVSGIRVIQGAKNMFVGMPSVKTDNPEYPYNSLCYLTKGSKDFVTGLIVGEAMTALGIEKKGKAEPKKEEPAKEDKKPSLDAQVKGAKGRQNKNVENQKRKGKEAEKEAEPVRS